MTKLKIFIDDIRNPPDDSWTVFRDSASFLDWLRLPDLPERLDDVEIISFDHDLGGEDTSRPIALFLEEWTFESDSGGHWFNELDIVTKIHSANPVGRAWLAQSLSRSTKFVEG